MILASGAVTAGYLLKSESSPKRTVKSETDHFNPFQALIHHTSIFPFKRHRSTKSLGSERICFGAVFGSIVI